MNTIKMTNLDFFPACVSVKSGTLCIVFEPASTISILFVFGRIIKWIILIRPNSKVCYSVQPYFTDISSCLNKTHKNTVFLSSV